jgi:hypothetical protein
MINILKEISIIKRDDAANSGNDTIVKLTNISDGVDGASVFGFSSEPNYLTIGAGESYVNSLNSTLDVRVLKPTGDAYSGQSNLDQIKEWSNNQEDVYISAITLDGFILIGDRHTSSDLCKIVVNEQLTNNDIFAFKITRKSRVSYGDSGSYNSGWFAGSNALSYFEFDDKNSNNVADGWSANNFDSTSFSSGVQTLVSDTIEANFIRTIYMPFNGQNMTFSADVTVSGTYSKQQLRIIYFDASDSIITSSTATLTNGRVSLNFNVRSNTSYLQLGVITQSSTGTVTTTISNLALKMGTDSTYTKF